MSFEAQIAQHSQHTLVPYTLFQVLLIKFLVPRRGGMVETRERAVVLPNHLPNFPKIFSNDLDVV